MNIYHSNSAHRSVTPHFQLSGTDGFGELSFDDKIIQEILFPIQLEKKYTSGDTLFREGDRIDFYYFIQMGNLKGYKLLTNGREQITRFIINNDLLLFPSMTTHNYSAELLTSTEITLYPKYEFDELVKNHDTIRNIVFSTLTQELSSSQQQILLLGRMAAAERVSTFLLNILERIIPDYKDQAAPIEITLPMTRADIADYLGLTIETVSRVFSKLRVDGIITLPKPNKVQFRNPAELQASQI